MLINYQLIKRYSKSLYDLSIELNKIKIIYKEINLLHSFLLKSNDIKHFFSISILDIKKKKKISENLFFNFSSLFQNFIFLLINHKREMYIKEIIEEFKKIYYKFYNIVEVYVTTACTLNELEINNIIVNSKLIKNMSNIIIHNIIDSNIIGGYILRVEDKEINYTIQSRINKIKEKFLK